MTTKISTLLTAFIFAITYSFGQTADDNINFLKIQNQINDGSYYRALETLSTISPSGRSSSFYLSYTATCYEKTYQFDKAALAYRQLYNKTNSFDAMKKVADMEQYQENKKSALAADSAARLKSDILLGEYKFKRDDYGYEYYVMIAKDKNTGGFLIGIWSLPDFELKTITMSDGKLTTENTDQPFYSFFGSYSYKFVNKQAVCNKELPKIIMYGQINKYFNEITLLIFGYDCIVNDDGSHTLRKRDANDRLKWTFSKVSEFNLR